MLRVGDGEAGFISISAKISYSLFGGGGGVQAQKLGPGVSVPELPD